MSAPSLAIRNSLLKPLNAWLRNPIKSVLRNKACSPPLESLYDEPEVRQRFPFTDILHETLRDAVLRPRTPVYNDISLAISRTLPNARWENLYPDAARL